MSWSLSTPTLPSLTPRAADPLWFSVDKPRDEETELTREEAEHNAVRSGIIEIHQVLCAFLGSGEDC